MDAVKAKQINHELKLAIEKIFNKHKIQYIDSHIKFNTSTFILYANGKPPINKGEFVVKPSTIYNFFDTGEVIKDAKPKVNKVKKLKTKKVKK